MDVLLGTLFDGRVHLVLLVLLARKERHLIHHFLLLYLWHGPISFEACHQVLSLIDSFTHSPTSAINRASVFAIMRFHPQRFRVMMNRLRRHAILRDHATNYTSYRQQRTATSSQTNARSLVAVLQQRCNDLQVAMRIVSTISPWQACQ